MTLGLAVSESAHFECDDKILCRLARVLDALSASACSTSRSEKYSFCTGSQFRAASLYHAIKPSGSEHRFTGQVAGLRCEVRPFQVRHCNQYCSIYETLFTKHAVCWRTWVRMSTFACVEAHHFSSVVVKVVVYSVYSESLF